MSVSIDKINDMHSTKYCLLYTILSFIPTDLIYEYIKTIHKVGCVLRVGIGKTYKLS